MKNALQLSRYPIHYCLLRNWRPIGRMLGFGRSSIDICVTLSIRAGDFKLENEVEHFSQKKMLEMSLNATHALTAVFK